MKLSQLKENQKARVVKLTLNGPIKKRLSDLGFTKNEIISVEKIAPLGDPIEIKVKGYKLSLRKKEAEKIEVERIEQ